MATVLTRALALDLLAGLAAARALLYGRAADLAARAGEASEPTNLAARTLALVAEETFCSTGLAGTLTVLGNFLLAELAELAGLGHHCALFLTEDL